MIGGILLLLALPFLPERLDESLLQASRAGDAEAVSVLVHAGAHPGARNSLTGWTSLTIASFYGYSKVVQELLAAGADPNATDLHGGTPLMKAIAIPGGDDPGMVQRKVQIVKLLLAAGADPQKKDPLGSTAWQAAMILEQKEFVEAFAAFGVRGVRETQLMEAVAWQDARAVRSLLEAGADVNYRDEAGWNALSESALAGDPSIVRMLLAHGAEVNARYEKGWTALMIAAHNHHTGAIRELLAAGADRRQRSDDGATALDIATAAGCIECENLLR